jgi:outer membrane lipoprotein SlyB
MNIDQLATIIGAVVGPLAGAVAAYYAIRQDLAVLRVRIDSHDQTIVQALKRADNAHERIDDVLSKR